MTQAQEKRNKRLTEIFQAKLKRQLNDFHNQYLNDHCQFRINEIKRDLNHYEKLANDSKFLREFNLQRSRWAQLTQQDALSYYKTRKRRLDNMALLQLEFLNEAETSYQKKLANLISKLVSYQFDTRFLKVEYISDGTYDKFSILVTNNDMEVEARFIYACGEIKIPHYRFIITKRTK